jgi:septal ring factor EnvC (AmiA/AmiB activator)
MAENSNSWLEYSRLVLNELERLNENHERMREDLAEKFQQISQSQVEFRNTERQVQDQKAWMEKVNDVWSPTQMKEAKDELYRQKHKWIAAIAIVSVIEIALTIVLALWGKF